MALNDEDLRRAEARMERLRAAGTATGVEFRSDTRTIVVSMSDGSKFSFSVDEADGLRHAEPENLEPIEISPTGLGLHWPKLDADLYVPALVEKAREQVRNARDRTLHEHPARLVTDRVVGRRRGEMHFELYKGKDGQWRWRLKAQNGNIIASSSEGYVHRSDCEHGIELVKKSASAKVVDMSKAA